MNGKYTCICHLHWEGEGNHEARENCDLIFNPSA